MVSSIDSSVGTERKLVTEIPGPKSKALHERRKAVVSAGLTVGFPIYIDRADGAIVVARSGWGKFWPDRKHYLGIDEPDVVADLHFPGYSPEAAEWLVKNRNLAAIAIDTASMDRGASRDFRVHRIWLGANKPGFENIANAGKLPPSGATIFCIPMKLGDGTGAPTRAFALMP